MRVRRTKTGAAVVQMNSPDNSAFDQVDLICATIEARTTNPTLGKLAKETAGKVEKLRAAIEAEADKPKPPAAEAAEAKPEGKPAA